MKIYESDKILVVNKPSGKVVSDFAEELKDEVEELKNLPRYGLAHRIDKDTSGLLLLAKTEEVLESKYFIPMEIEDIVEELNQYKFKRKIKKSVIN